MLLRTMAQPSLLQIWMARSSITSTNIKWIIILSLKAKYFHSSESSLAPAPSCDSSCSCYGCFANSCWYLSPVSSGDAGSLVLNKSLRDPAFNYATEFIPVCLGDHHRLSWARRSLPWVWRWNDGHICRQHERKGAQCDAIIDPILAWFYIASMHRVLAQLELSNAICCWFSDLNEPVEFGVFRSRMNQS